MFPVRILILEWVTFFIRSLELLKRCNIENLKQNSNLIYILDHKQYFIN